MAVTLTYLQGNSTVDNLTIYTFAGENLGTASAQRRIVVLGATKTAAEGELVPIVTVGGIAATVVNSRHAIEGTSSSRLFVAIAHVPMGTTGDVVIDWGTPALRCGLHMYQLDGVTNNDCVQYYIQDLPNTGLSVPIPTGGTLLLYAVNFGNTAPTDWWGGFQDGNVTISDSAGMSFGVGHSDYASATIINSPNATLGGSTYGRLVIGPSSGANTMAVVGDYAVHKFQQSGDLVISGGPVLVEAFLVGGGGSSGDNTGISTSTGSGGGGGGGIVRLFAGIALADGTYPIVVGGGGAVVRDNQGGNGGNSTFAGYTAFGGGGGGFRAGSTTGGARDGGTGGGSGYNPATVSVSGSGYRSQYSSAQGQNGGFGSNVFGGGGGGGYLTGGNPTIGSTGEGGATGGVGGDGYPLDWEGSTVYYGGGGAGGSRNNASWNAAGGLGGGGTGGSTVDLDPGAGANAGTGTAGTDGLGGGGGGMARVSINSFGSPGGDGVVIIRTRTVPLDIEGGTLIDVGGGEFARKFTQSGDLIIRNTAVDVERLIVGGGGGGGDCTYSGAGGGGAGGLLTNYGGTLETLAPGVYPVVLGEGGIGGGVIWENGGSSLFNGLTAIGGGRGGNSYGDNWGRAGGSGGGAGSGGFYGAGTSGQGNAGGLDSPGGQSGGGGGGHASVGANGVDSTTGGAGGTGTAYDIDGTSRTYATGGEGVGTSTGEPPARTDGLGEGGCGVPDRYVNQYPRGGDGVVVIRYTPPTGGGTLVDAYTFDDLLLALLNGTPIDGLTYDQLLAEVIAGTTVDSRTFDQFLAVEL